MASRRHRCDEAGARRRRPLRVHHDESRRARRKQSLRAAAASGSRLLARGVDALETELGPRFGPLVVFAAETGLRPSEWAALERRHVDRARRVLTVHGTKTRGSRREVPLTLRAIAALDRSPARLGSPLLFPADRGGVLNLDNWRRRVWAPAVESSGVARPARIYDLRSTFASRALAAGDRSVRALPDHGHVNRDDRGALRRSALRVERVDRCSARRDRVTFGPLAGHEPGLELERSVAAIPHG